MDESQFNALLQLLAKVSARVDEIAENQKNLVTKDELKASEYQIKKDLGLE